MANIAFIGLGNMGGPMAANLVKAGHKVIAFDLVEASRDAAKADGAAIADSAVAAVKGADVVITMLPAGKHVLSVWNEVLPVDDQGHADHRLLDHRRRKRQAGPCAGGQAWHRLGRCAGLRRHRRRQGRDADLHVRRRATRRSRRPSRCWKTMGKKIVHCGGAGAGQAAKICNNMILGISMIAVGEAFALAEKLGLSHQALFDVASTSSGQCWALTTYCPVPGPVPTSPANNDYKPGFASALMVKDLTLAQDAAKATGAATPLGKHAQEIYKAFDAAGHGGVDFSGIIQHVRGLAGK